MAEQSMFSNLYDIETIQNRNADTSAMNAAQLEPGRATVYGAGVAGNMLSSGLNNALGRPTAQEQKSAIVNDIMKRNANLDPTDPKSQLALKKEFLEYNLPDFAMAFDKKYTDMMASIPVRTKTIQNGVYYWDDTGLPVVKGATENYDSDPKKAAFQIYTRSEKFKDSKTPGADVLAWNKDWDEKNPSGGNEGYASKITDIMDSINGDTTIGGDLYDPAIPGGRKFTRNEAETKFEENKRETSGQKIDVARELSNMEFADETVIAAASDSQQADLDIKSFDNILNAYKLAPDGTGKLQASFLSTKGLLRTLGYEGDIDALMSQEILLAEFEELALGRMANLSGSASDNDIAFVRAGGPSFDKTPEANILLIKQAMEMSVEAQKKAAFIRSYVANYKASGGKEGSPSTWELTSAIEAFKNRGDYSESAKSRYGSIWERADFINAQGTREELIKKHGLNQLNTWERYDKMKAGDTTLGNITEKYESNATKSRRLIEEDLGED